MGALGVGWIGHVQAGEGIEAEVDRDLETLRSVGANYSVDCGGKLAALQPISKQIDVLARSFQNAMSGNRIAAGQRETIARTDA